MGNPDYRNVRGHIEVYDEGGKFLFSEDNLQQAVREYEQGYCSRVGNYCKNSVNNRCDLPNNCKL